jgi:hypothetical protein
MMKWQNIINAVAAPRPALILGSLLIGVNALLIWTLEHTDIVAFATVLIFSSVIIFCGFATAARTQNFDHRIDSRLSQTSLSEAQQPQDQIEP